MMMLMMILLLFLMGSLMIVLSFPATLFVVPIASFPEKKSRQADGDQVTEVQWMEKRRKKKTRVVKSHKKSSRVSRGHPHHQKKREQTSHKKKRMKGREEENFMEFRVTEQDFFLFQQIHNS